ALDRGAQYVRDPPERTGSHCTADLGCVAGRFLANGLLRTPLVRAARRCTGALRAQARVPDLGARAAFEGDRRGVWRRVVLRRACRSGILGGRGGGRGGAGPPGSWALWRSGVPGGGRRAAAV